jgi:hypothetical protein
MPYNIYELTVDLFQALSANFGRNCFNKIGNRTETFFEAGVPVEFRVEFDADHGNFRATWAKGLVKNFNAGRRGGRGGRGKFY